MTKCREGGVYIERHIIETLQKLDFPPKRRFVTSHLEALIFEKFLEYVALYKHRFSYTLSYSKDASEINSKDVRFLNQMSEMKKRYQFLTLIKFVLLEFRTLGSETRQAKKTLKLTLPTISANI